MTGCTAAPGHATPGQREGVGPAAGIDSSLAQSERRLLALSPPLALPAVSVPQPRRLAGVISRKRGCSLPAVARRRDPPVASGWRGLFPGARRRYRGGCVCGGGGITMSTMFADTLLIVFISVCTALLAEGECRAGCGVPASAGRWGLSRLGSGGVGRPWDLRGEGPGWLGGDWQEAAPRLCRVAPEGWGVSLSNSSE